MCGGVMCPQEQECLSSLPGKREEKKNDRNRGGGLP